MEFLQQCVALAQLSGVGDVQAVAARAVPIEEDVGQHKEHLEAVLLRVQRGDCVGRVRQLTQPPAGQALIRLPVSGLCEELQQSWRAGS